MALTSAVRGAVASVHADTPIYFVDTLAGRVAESTWVYNVFGVLFMVFGGVALFLASIGLYGVMAFSVSLVQVALGVTLGLGIAVVVSRALSLVMFQVGAGDPGVFGLVAGVLLLTGVLASAIPARRATRIDPIVALRSD